MYCDGALLKMRKIKSSKKNGFTLIELMVAIVLGLLITAAAIQLFITGQLSLSTQKAMADLQESGNFGLRYISRDIRKTNYGNVNIVNDRLANGGVVLTTRHTPLRPISVTSFDDTTIPVNLDIRNGATPAMGVNLPRTTYAIGSSNVQVLSDSTNPASNKVDQNSDQLVIQFYANEDGVDCEGNNYTANRYVIERFFLRTDANASSGEPNTALALACEAGSYVDNTANTILKNPSTSTAVFGSTNGEIIVRRVDHLHFLLGISNDTNNGDLRYISIEKYLELNQSPRPRINSIQLAMLVRSDEGINAGNLIKNDQTFNMLDQTVTIKLPTGTPPKYLRRVVTQTIALRNANLSIDTAVM